MNDRHPTELLSAYLDGEVTTSERIEVARHLEVCVECRGVLDDFRTMATAASQEPAPPIPAELQARIMAALRTRSPKPRRRFAPWFPVPLAVAAGLIVVAAGSWVLLRRQPGQEPVVMARSAPVEKPRLEEAYRVPAPQPPPPPGAPPGRDASDSLRSLGYIASDRQTGAARKQKEPASPEAAPSTTQSGFDAASKTAEASRSQATTEPRKLALFEAPRPALAARSLVFEFEGAEGTLTDAGLVTLVRESGACSVDLAETRAMGEEVRLIFHLARAGPAPRPAARLDETKAQERGRGIGSAVGAGVPGTLQDKDERPVRLLRILPTAQRPLDPAGVEMVEERLRLLLDVTAREVITARCGAAPARSPHGE
ncbi:MAG TPA: zf-HC2 domain-containing protein [Candidatus Cryosericum sp.]|nr:zf-HC2 domain-containing protein [Candidatus Cryosericum sp.]